MDEAFVGGWEGEGEEVGEDGEGEVRGHGVGCRVVDWEADDEEEEGVRYRVEVDVDEAGPDLGACWRAGFLSGYGLGRSGCGKGFELRRAVGDADLRGVLGSGWKSYVANRSARGVIVSF